MNQDLSDFDADVQDIVELLKTTEVSDIVQSGLPVDRNRYDPTPTGSLPIIRTEQLRGNTPSANNNIPELSRLSGRTQQSNAQDTRSFQTGGLSGTGSSQPGESSRSPSLASKSRLLQLTSGLSSTTTNSSSNNTQPTTAGGTAGLINPGSSGSTQPHQVTDRRNTQSLQHSSSSQGSSSPKTLSMSNAQVGHPEEFSVGNTNTSNFNNATAFSNRITGEAHLQLPLPNQAQTDGRNATPAEFQPSNRTRSNGASVEPQDQSIHGENSVGKISPLSLTSKTGDSTDDKTGNSNISHMSMTVNASIKRRQRSKKDQKAEIAVEVRRYHLMVNGGKVQEALEMFRTKLQEPSLPEAVLVYNAQLCTHFAGVLLNEKRPMNAIEVLKEGLQLYDSGRLKADNRDTTDALWHLHDQLAVAYSANDDSAQEAVHYEKAIAILEQYDTHPERYYHMMNNLGNCYKSLKQHDKARGMLERANTEMSKIYPLLSDGRINERLQKAINSLASLYKSIDEIDLAIEKYELLVDAIERQNPNVEPLARLWEAKLNLAQLYEKSNRKADAEKILESMRAAQGNGTEDDGIERTPQYWNSQCVLYVERGIFAQKQKDHKLAVDSYEKAYRAYMKAPLQVDGDEKTHETLAKIHNNMGNSYQALRNFPKALESLREGLAIRKKLNGDAVPNKELASSYFNLANLLMVMDEEHTIKESIELYEKTIEIYQQLSAEHIPKLAKWLARSYKHLASIYQAKKLFHKAIEYFKKAQQLYEGTLEGNIDDYQGMCNNLGNAFESIEDYDQAQTMIKRSLDLCERLIKQKPHDPSLQNRKAACLNNLGIAYKGARQFTESREYLTQCYQLRLKLIEDFDDQEARDDIAGTCQNLGNTYNDEKAYEKASEWLEKAVELYERFGMSSQAARVTLSLLYEKMGLLGKALEIVK